MITPSQVALMRCKASGNLADYTKQEPLSKDSLKFLKRAKEGCLEKISRVICSFLRTCLSFCQLIPGKIVRGVSWVRSKCRRSSGRVPKVNKKVSKPLPQRDEFMQSIAKNYPCDRVRLNLIVDSIMQLVNEQYSMTACKVEHLEEGGISFIFKKAGSEIVMKI